MVCFFTLWCNKTSTLYPPPALIPLQAGSGTALDGASQADIGFQTQPTFGPGPITQAGLPTQTQLGATQLPTQLGATQLPINTQASQMQLQTQLGGASQPYGGATMGLPGGYGTFAGDFTQASGYGGYGGFGGVDDFGASQYDMLLSQGFNDTQFIDPATGEVFTQDT